MSSILFNWSITLVLICHAYIVSAQSSGLQVGDTIPNIKAKNVINTPSNELALSNLRGKLVILQFWSTRCISCIRELPRFDSLQEQFKHDVQIVLVTKDHQEAVESFFEKRKHVRFPTLPIITGDSLLHKLFPSNTVSLSVWVNAAGTVDYLTEAAELSNRRITGYLAGTKQKLIEFKGKVVYRNSLFDTTLEEQLESFSYLARYNRINIKELPDTSHATIIMYNSSALELYKEAFNEGGRLKLDRPKRIELQLSDTFKYVRPHRSSGYLGDWLQKYAYVYHLKLPSLNENVKYKIMQEDLKRYIGLDALLEKRIVPGYALVRTTSADKLTTKGGKSIWKFSSSTLYIPKADTAYIINKPFEMFAGWISSLFEYSFGMPIEDQTCYRGNIDIEMPQVILDSIASNSSEGFYEFQKYLDYYGLALQPKNFEVDVLVVSDRKITPGQIP